MVGDNRTTLPGVQSNLYHTDETVKTLHEKRVHIERDTSQKMHVYNALLEQFFMTCTFF